MEEIKVNYTREELIEICEKAIVQEKDWQDRDTESSQCKVGECWALLKAGCDFEVIYEDDTCATDETTIWLYVYSEGFRYFEYASADDNDYKETHHYYLPTKKRLEQVNGKDWY